ncbi:hypothetical protein R3P38DRAFT_3044435 [Favolaschia claudopus]|uniref:Zn(2)-C6 fungal-type domain-containing protein n=1 Tax=Favolaschia claudopus TaxID=2862362 RepID=A0AAW0A6W2_9AGAR
MGIINAGPSSNKKQRPRPSCDICRRQKGDSASQPDNKCTNCKSFNSECTHNMSRSTQHPRGTRR